MNDPVVRLDGVTKRFTGHTAVRGLTLAVPAGGIFGLLGPNGAGKTTTIRMLMSIIEPDEGTIEIFGRVANRALNDRIGFLPEERGLYRRMGTLEHLIFLGEIKGLGRREARDRARRWLERLGLGEWEKSRVEDLSKGMQQKVQFIGTLLHQPDLVVLDEPFSGLDPVNSQVMRDAVVEIAREGRTVLFSTHIMEQAERMCDGVAILARGAKVVDGPMVDVKRRAIGQQVALAFTRNAERAAAVLADRALIAGVDDYGGYAEATLAKGAEPDRLLAALVGAGVGIGRFELVEPSLQAIFMAAVGREAAVSARNLEVA